MLFNKLIGQRLSIVEDTPGVTRDRIYGECEWCGRKFTLVDTGGIEPRTDSQILTFMREQAQIAIENATVIIFLTDIKTGLTASDQEVANMLLRSRKPIVLAVNKMDSVGARESRLLRVLQPRPRRPCGGLRRPRPRHGRPARRLRRSTSPTRMRRRRTSDVLKVAIIGKPNVGKSSPDEPHSRARSASSSPTSRARRATPSTPTLKTRPANMSSSTPPVCAKSPRIEESIEKYSVLRATMAIDRADVCLIMIDATEGVTEQDTKVAGLAHEAGKACIIVVNKWDACREGRQDHGQDARGHPPRSELYDLRAHPVHLGV